jgi:hypothetical protein
LFTCLENYVLIFVVLLGFVVEDVSPFAHLVSTSIPPVIIWPRGGSVSTLLIRKEFRTTTTTATTASAEKYTMTYSGKCQKLY